MIKRKLHPGAVRILRFGLPFIAVAAVYVALSTAEMSAYDSARLGQYIFDLLEHVAMSLTILIGGALIYDISQNER